MARERLPIGEHGSVGLWQAKSGRWRAQTRYRGTDGKLKSMTAWGDTSEQAASALEDKFDRWRNDTDEITPGMPLAAAVKRWQKKMRDDADLTDGTKYTYAQIIKAAILPHVEHLTIGDMTPIRQERLESTIRAKNGQGSAKTARTVLRGVYADAVLAGALPLNPVGAAGTRKKRSKKPVEPVRGLTRKEEAHLLAFLRTDERSQQLDIADLITFMLGTGCRIGETLAAQCDALDLKAGTFLVKRTMTARGMQEHPKTWSSRRLVALPDHVVEMLRRRIADPDIATDVAVFPSPFGLLRCTRNTSRHLRQTLDAAGLGWATSHSFRRTAATRLHEAGLPDRDVSDHLGHTSIAMTQQRYIGRVRSVPKARDALRPEQA